MNLKLQLLFLLISIKIFSQANIAPNGGFENWSTQNNVTVNNNFLGNYSLNYSINSIQNPSSNVFYNVPCGNSTITANYQLTTPPNLFLETFGSGANISLPANTISSAYCYNDQVSRLCPPNADPLNPFFDRLEDSQYVVTKAIIPNNSSWFPFRDHTTNGVDVNGRFLAINIGSAAGPNGILYSNKIYNVIPNQPIIIEAYGANLIRANLSGLADPGLTFEIRTSTGVLLSQQPLLPNVDLIFKSNTWQLKTASLNPGDVVTPYLIFNIRSASIFFNGNDVAIDDIKIYQSATSCVNVKEFAINIPCNQTPINQITNYSNITCDGLVDGNFSVVTNNTETPIGWKSENNVSKTINDFSQGLSCAKLSISNNTLSPKIKSQIFLNNGITYVVKYKYKYLNSNFSGLHPVVLNIINNSSNSTSNNSSFASNNDWTTITTTFTPDESALYNFSIALSSSDNQAFDVLIDNFQVFEEYTRIPDVNFENKLKELNIDFGTNDEKVLTEDIIELQNLNVSNLVLSKSTENSLTTNVLNLKGIEKFDALKNLNCANNSIVNLDLSENKFLTSINCSNNQLISLNIKNNNNSLITNANIDLRNNNLVCIQVDDVVYSNSNWSNKKDLTSSFSESCPVLNLTNSVFEKIAIYPNPAINFLNIDNVVIQKITFYNTLGSIVKTLNLEEKLNNSIDLLGFSKGIYLLKLENQQESIVKKIIIE